MGGGQALTAGRPALPIKNGTSYQIEWPDSGEKSSLDVVRVSGPARPTSSARRRFCSRTAARSSSTCSSKARARPANNSGRSTFAAPSARDRLGVEAERLEHFVRMFSQRRWRKIAVGPFAIEPDR